MTIKQRLRVYREYMHWWTQESRIEERDTDLKEGTVKVETINRVKIIKDPHLPAYLDNRIDLYV